MNRLLTILLLLLCSGCMERRIRVTTHPAGAKVFVNDQLAGISPCTIRVPAPKDEIFSDPYIIEAHKDNYLSAMYYLPVAAPNTMLDEQVELRLAPLAGTEMLRRPAKPFPRPALAEPDPAGPPRSKPPRIATKPKPAVTTPADPDPMEPEPVDPETAITPPAKPTEPDPEPILARPLNSQTPTAAMRFNCEVRLIRMSDGKTLVHASTLGPYSDKYKLASLLAGRIRKQWPRGRLAVLTFRNRRHSLAGKALAAEMPDLLAAGLGNLNFAGEIKTLDLENSGIENHDREHPDILKNKALAPHLVGADYVLLGGVSETNE